MTTQVRALTSIEGDVSTMLWTPVFDDSSGMYFYQNNETGETQWESPFEEQPLDEQPFAVDDQEVQEYYEDHQAFTVVAAVADDVWDAVWDEGNQAYYYYNASTGASQW